MSVFNQMSAEMRGYINEMQSQIVFLSDRAGGLASSLAKAEETVELQKGRIAALEAKEKELGEELERRRKEDETEKAPAERTEN